MMIPNRPRWLLLLSLAYLPVATFWLGPEDSIWLAAVLGWLGSALGVANAVTVRLGGRTVGGRKGLMLAVGIGLAVGVGAGVVTVALMLMKTAAHSHGPFPDFPATVVVGIVARMPVWAAAGALAGLALGLVSRKDEADGGKEG